MARVLQPGDTVGLIGGGQLGRAISAAAGRLGFKTLVLEPMADCPAAQFAHGQIVADYEDPEAVFQLLQKSDVVTYEFENVSVESLEKVADDTPVFPPVSALAISQDRLVEKDFITAAGLKTAPYATPSNTLELSAALEEIGGKGILKTRRFGYDGKGQAVVSTSEPEAACAAFEEMSQAPLILEGFVPFAYETSVIGARSPNGETAFYDPAENVHRGGILRTSTVPGKVSEAVATLAKEQAGQLLDRLDYVGVIGVEFFVTKDDQLLINEFAPRVHNSGHWTEAGCLVSQFEQHVRAIAGLPLGSTRRHSDCVMENLIGHDMDHLPRHLAEPNSMVHLYGKAEIRDGRKMGHVNRISPRKG